MREWLMKEYIRFRHCEDGVTLVEYGIALALAVQSAPAPLRSAGDVNGIMGDASGDDRRPGELNSNFRWAGEPRGAGPSTSRRSAHN